MVLALAIAAAIELETAAAVPSAPRLLDLEGDLGVHDPTIAREGDWYWVYSTSGGPRGGGILPIRSSKDLRAWTRRGAVFDRLPEWAPKEIPGARGAWAPDISRFRGKYHLYYSVSTFGRNDSAIGLATTESLDPGSPKQAWVDRGLVLRSRQGKDDWNAIDPEVAVEGEADVWLAWGSFWGGIKMRRLDPETGKLSEKDPTLWALAARPRSGPEATDGSIEAPCLVRHDGSWYLFVSFDLCCRGKDSTYRILVGRSDAVTGPYAARDGKPMLEGGATPVLEATTPRWRGPGHCDVLQEPTGDWLVFHAYDGRTGRSELKVSSIAWKDGWPRVAPLP